MSADSGRLADREAIAEAIRRLGEDDLVYLNRLIVERCKLIAQARSTALLAHFTVGDRVSFQASSGERMTGEIVKLNKKTATICTGDGRHWKVHPSFLTRDTRDGAGKEETGAGPLSKLLKRQERSASGKIVPPGHF